MCKHRKDGDRLRNSFVHMLAMSHIHRVRRASRCIINGRERGRRVLPGGDASWACDQE